MSEEHNIQKKVLDKIRAGSVGMRSHAYFVARASLIGITAGLVLIFSLFVLSYVFFSIRESGTHLLLTFGAHGVATFAALFPWAFFILCLLLLFFLGEMIRRHTSAYRLSLIRLFGGILSGSIALSALIMLTPLHSSFLSAADHDRLPFLKSWYDQIHRSHTDRGIYRGTVVTVATSSFTIAHNETDPDSDEGTWTVEPPTNFNIRALAVGEKVYVAGTAAAGTIRAFGIRVVPPRLK
ncbi:hypothetical protein KGM48_01690 [Patescibacteria group bacterium]|nr:hypothetical protein [Patescibacteria group bacterium]